MRNMFSSQYARAVVNWLTLTPIIYVFTLMWWISDGSKYVPGLVIFSLLILFAARNLLNTNTCKNPHFDSFLKLLWLYVVYGAFVYIVRGGSWSELRAFLSLALYMQFARRLMLPDSWRIGLLMASSLALTMLASGEYLLQGGRVGGNINPIPFATVIGVLFLALYALVIVADKSARLKVIATVLLFALMVSLMMTQTRGVLIPVLVTVVVVLLWAGSKQPGVRFRRIVLALLVTLFAAGSGLAVLNTGRIAQTLDEVEAVSAGDLSTSIGIRLQLWRATLPLIADSPLIGHGDGYRDALKLLHDRGDLSSDVYHFNALHFHNQFLDIWVKKGALGLFLLIALLLMATKLFSSSGMTLWRRVGGVSIVFLLTVAALTDVPLMHVPVIFYFGFMLFLLAADKPKMPKLEGGRTVADVSFV